MRPLLPRVLTASVKTEGCENGTVRPTSPRLAVGVLTD